MKLKKEDLLLYAVTDRAWTGKLTLYEQVEKALKGGATMVQLREKELDVEAYLKEAVSIRKLCNKYNVPFIVDDDLYVALKSGADGIHVGIEDMPVDKIRSQTGNDFIIGATAKTIRQARAAMQMGADYLGVGAVFASATKKNAIRISKEELAAITASVDIPSVAIGGIELTNINELTSSGVSGVAVVSAIFGAEDIELAAARLKKEVLKILQVKA